MHAPGMLTVGMRRPGARPASVTVRAAVLLLGLGLGTHPGHAAQSERAMVRLDGRSVFRVTATDSLTARDRADQIERRLGSLAGAPGRLGAPVVERDAGGRHVITVSGIPVVTITANDAAESFVDPATLAVQWAEAVGQELIEARARRASRTAVGTGIEGALRAAVARLAESVLTVIPRAVAAMLVLGLTWAVAVAARRGLRMIFRRTISDRTVENLIRQVTYYAIWLLGFVVAVDALGFRPQTVVTGLGLTGLALGFALKDIISNFVSGLLLLALRPFELGDEIVVGETEGRVERIELRATQIRTYDGRAVLVPNAEIFTSRVVNNTAAPVRRGSIDCTLGYGDDLRRASTALASAAASAPGVLEQPPVSVRIRELTASDVLMEVRFWTDSRRSDLLATSHAVRLGAIDALRSAGIALPDGAVRKVIIADRMPPGSGSGSPDA